MKKSGHEAKQLPISRHVTGAPGERQKRAGNTITPQGENQEKMGKHGGGVVREEDSGVGIARRSIANWKPTGVQTLC